MSVFVPLADGCQVEIVHVLDGKSIENRLWFTFDNPPWDSTALQGLADGVAAWWVDTILPYLSDQLFTAFVGVRDWTDPSTPTVAITFVSMSGGIAAESCSANVALVIPFRWPLGIRLKRNKHYVPGVPETEITLNTPSEDIKVAMFEGYNSLIDRARLFTPVLNWRWRVTSQWEDGVARSTQLVYDTQGTVTRGEYKIGQRRKRLPLT